MFNVSLCSSRIVLIELQGDATSNDGGSALCAYIETEKQLLADIDASTLAAGSSHGNEQAVRALFAQANFVSAVARGENSTDIHTFLAQRLGRHALRQRNLTYRTFREFAGVFLQKGSVFLPRWIEQDRQHSFTAQCPGVSRLAGGMAALESSPPGFDKPFSLAEDSITRQLGRHQEPGSSHQHALKRRRKADPMK